jgi:polyhydroxyalkanoate synthase
MADQSGPLPKRAVPAAKAPKAPEAAPDMKLPDPVELSRIMSRIAEQSHGLVSAFLTRQAPPQVETPDPLNIGQAFFDMTARIMANPMKLVQAQMSLWSDYMSLWQSTARKVLGEPSEPVVKVPAEDRRFKDSLWDENYLFDYIKQSYLLSARWMQSLVRDVEGLDEKRRKSISTRGSSSTRWRRATSR